MSSIPPAPRPVTPRNQPENGEILQHLLTDLHDALKLLYKHDELLEEFRPMIETWRRTNGGTIGLMRARKAMRNGG